MPGKTLPYGGNDPAPFVDQGHGGSKLPKLVEKTVWIAGSTAEVAWGIFANHGGGYSYRLCPAGSELTEECFQKMPLDFVGNTQWLQFGDGMDTSNRTEVPASTMKEGTFPPGSQWRRNPVPACAGGNMGTGGGTGPQNPCNVPEFPPSMPGVFGGGLGGNPKQIVSAEVGIVDRVHVPKVPPGDYVLSFRWDCEQTPQVWQNCADVTIKDQGEPTKPFTPLTCEGACCSGGWCANCTSCLNDKTGVCAYCWEKHTWDLEGYVPIAMTCLGHEDKTGGPTYSDFKLRDLTAPWRLLFLENGVSPGCPKCWANKDACSVRERPSEASLVV